jgi:hypothetical protein
METKGVKIQSLKKVEAKTKDNQPKVDLQKEYDAAVQKAEELKLSGKLTEDQIEELSFLYDKISKFTVVSGKTTVDEIERWNRKRKQYVDLVRSLQE